MPDLLLLEERGQQLLCLLAASHCYRLGHMELHPELPLQDVPEPEEGLVQELQGGQHQHPALDLKIIDID